MTYSRALPAAGFHRGRSSCRRSRRSWRCRCSNPASDFLFQNIGALPRPAHNPVNDIEANVVLAAPTASGISAGTVPTTGPNVGMPVLPNNVIPFDLVKATVPIVNWGDSTQRQAADQLLTSVLGINTVPMTLTVLPGSTKVAQVMDPVSGGPLYSIYYGSERAHGERAD